MQINLRVVFLPTNMSCSKNKGTKGTRKKKMVCVFLHVSGRVYGTICHGDMMNASDGDVEMVVHGPWPTMPNASEH